MDTHTQNQARFTTLIAITVAGTVPNRPHNRIKGWHQSFQWTYPGTFAIPQTDRSREKKKAPEAGRAAPPPGAGLLPVCKRAPLVRACERLLDPVVDRRIRGVEHKLDA